MKNLEIYTGTKNVFINALLGLLALFIAVSIVALLIALFKGELTV